MNNEYGMDRVLEPGQVLPTSAWKLDNSRELRPNEMRIALERVHIEGTSFRRMYMESAGDPEAMKQKITDIVIRRGKLHNPVTDTGGLLSGVVEEIGPEFDNRKGFRPGDKVMYNASLASMPINIDRIGKIDLTYNQIEAEGYAIAHSSMPVVKRPEGIPIDLLLLTLNESGTLYRVSTGAAGKEKILVVGNNMMMNLIFGHTIRKAAGREAVITNVMDKRTNTIVKGPRIDELIKKTFDDMYYMNILRPMECMDTLRADGYYDMSVNCADIPGAETLNVLATKNGGTVIFANFMSNYNIALYITESISRSLNIRFADGYTEEYDEFDLEIVRDLAPYFKDVSTESRSSRGRADQEPGPVGNYTVLDEDIVSKSEVMSGIIDEVMSVAKYDCNVLITGDTGAGKEKIADLIQKNSSRSMHPFVKVNCASISPALMESEFFGYEPGAFTGAGTTGKKGFFEIADNGMIFLDEVGELPPDMQAKLLRVLQDGEFFKVGGTVPVKTNVRVISATNRKLEDLVDAGKFRRDLYYRLNVFPVTIPGLAERREDICPLVNHFIEKYCRKFSIEKTIDDNALEYLENMDWPGNIRELENTIQRLLISSKGESISLMDIMREVHVDMFDKTSGRKGDDEKRPETDGGASLPEMVEDFERKIIESACEKYGSTRKAAAAIGISQTQLVRKKKKYGL